DFLAVAVEGGREELQKAGEAEQVTSERPGREANPRAPFAVFDAVREPQGDFRVADGDGAGCDPLPTAGGGVRQINPDECCQRFGECAVICPRVEQCIAVKAVGRADKGYTDYRSGTDPSASERHNRMARS